MFCCDFILPASFRVLCWGWGNNAINLNTPQWHNPLGYEQAHDVDLRDNHDTTEHNKIVYTSSMSPWASLVASDSNK